MKVLIVGAGATGGYFGGRLLEAGRDVTFLVRARRAAQLARTGLRIQSPIGNVDIPDPPRVEPQDLRGPFDLILLSCKAYDLEDAIASFAPAVGPDTAILPVLNGMRHLDTLERKFGARAVLGGLCAISVALDPDGNILHLNRLHSMTYGERSARTPRTDAILATLRDARFDVRASDTILAEMWSKWVFIATAAGMTCLMRGSVGDIVAAGAADIGERLYEECAAIAADAGFPESEAAGQRTRSLLSAAGSSLTASMLRDIEAGGRTEGEQILGDLLARRTSLVPPQSLLRTACLHLRAYEARRERERNR